MPELLPSVERALHECENAVDGGARYIELRGQEGAGKSALLAAMTDAISRPMVRLAPPLYQPDDATWAYAQLLDGLESHVSLDGTASTAADPSVPWPVKLQALAKAVDETRGLLILCDEPGHWGAAQDPHFKGHGTELVEMLARRSNVQVLFSGNHVLEGEDRSVVEIGTGDPRDWGELAANFAALQARLSESVSPSPLAWRLAVALATVAGVERAEDELRGDASIGRLTRSFVDEVRARGEEQEALLRFLSGLRHARGLVDDDVLSVFGVDELSGTTRDIALRCLTFDAGSERLVHPTVRRTLAEILPDEAQTHRRLAEHFWPGETGARPVQPQHIEAFHQAGATGDAQYALGFTVAFVDQLTALGRDLSVRQNDHEAAAAIFERAVELAPRDDYALHYLAHNLDSLARQPQRVERLYRGALELDDSNPWWHGRLIGFLIARGRAADARAAWEEALVRAHPRWEMPEHWLYRNLHFWVAYGWMVHGHYDTAREVLDSTPSELIEVDSGFRGLHPRLEALSETSEWGAFVPGDQWEPEWWHRPPVLLPEIEAGKELRTWFAGRIAEVAGDSVHLDAVEIAIEGTPADGRPPVVSMSLPIERFRTYAGFVQADAVFAGRYFQMGFYGNEGTDDGRVRIALHRVREWQSTLPAFRPDPFRWALATNLLAA